MTCQIELINAGGAYPRSCPDCKFGPCKKGLPHPFEQKVTPAKTMSIRDEFQADYLEKYGNSFAGFGLMNDGAYRDVFIERCWQLYQAATERALRIVREAESAIDAKALQENWSAIEKMQHRSNMLFGIRRRIKGDDTNG